MKLQVKVVHIAVSFNLHFLWKIAAEERLPLRCASTHTCAKMKYNDKKENWKIAYSVCFVFLFSSSSSLLHSIFSLSDVRRKISNFSEIYCYRFNLLLLFTVKVWLLYAELRHSFLALEMQFLRLTLARCNLNIYVILINSNSSSFFYCINRNLLIVSSGFAECESDSFRRKNLPLRSMWSC